MATDRLDRILDLCQSKRPNLRLRVKSEVWYMRLIHVFVRYTTPDFMTHYTTVLGDNVYLPKPPDQLPRDQLARTLAHELIHQLDMAEWGIGFYLTYGVLPLPIIRSARAHWERRGYAVGMMLAYEDRGEPGLARFLDWLEGIFAGPTYGWMYAGRRSARAYLEATADTVRQGQLQEQAPYDEILAAWRGTTHS